jgi:hypothetical protein
MFVPFELVEVLLGWYSTVREAFLVSYPVLKDNDMLYICLLFLDLLQIASTQPIEGNPRPVTLQDRLGMVDYPVRPVVLNQIRIAVIYRLLPDLHPVVQGHLPDSFRSSLSDGLTNIATEMHADRRSREMRVLEATRPNTFHERYWERMADEILLLASATDDDFLPAFYQKLGGKSKGESERVLLQREVDQCAEVFDAPPFGVYPFQALTSLAYPWPKWGPVVYPSASSLLRLPPSLTLRPYPSTTPRWKPLT